MTRPTKEALSLAFEANGRKDPTLEKIPVSDLYISSAHLNSLTEAIGSVYYRCGEKVSKALGLKDKKAFFEKTPAEQKRAVVSQPEEVRDALRRAHAAKAAQDMFLCLPELSKEKAAFKRSKGEAAQKESAGRMASLEKEMKECRRTVVAFMRGNTVPAVLRRGSPER